MSDQDSRTPAVVHVGADSNDARQAKSESAPVRHGPMTQHNEIPSHRHTRTRLAGVLQMMANVAVIALCGLVGWLAVRKGAPAPVAPPSGPPVYRVGEVIDPVRGVDFRAARSTLVMVVREDCHFCQESLPFYRQLSDAHVKQPNPTLRIVVASTDAHDALSTYLQSKGVRVDQVSTIESGALKVPGTPALLLVDQTGRILNLWRGKLPERQEKEVFRILGLVPAA